MSLTTLVFAKQVPDTKNIKGDAMKADGTVNRAALPAIFNPEDLNALEMALQIRGRFGGKVIIATMGPPGATALLRHALYMGADEAILVTDRAFAGSDTLATSYTLSCAVAKYGKVDIVLCGRQAIDGDTAQVGPQTAEKMGVPQLCYVDEVKDIAGGVITARCEIEGGYEVVSCPLPALLTVVGSANTPRPAGAKRLMRFKKAKTRSELLTKYGGRDYEEAEAFVQEGQKLRDQGLWIHEWSAADIGAATDRVGIPGSPTKVKKIESVVLAGDRKFKSFPATQEGCNDLVHELIHEHILS